MEELKYGNHIDKITFCGQVISDNEYFHPTKWKIYDENAHHTYKE